MSELIVDSFAGGGGTSTGIAMAIGRCPDIGINHDRKALAMHRANHPRTTHYAESIFDIKPRAVTHGKPVGFMWASPDCTHHSRAKGDKPVSNERRGLADAVITWAEETRPRVIGLENVREFEEWGPIDPVTMRPIRAQKGEMFDAWVNKLQRLGYRVEWRALRASDYGVPTSRTRLFLVARCDGAPIAWPRATFGAPDAASCIDWTVPTRSIFGRKKDLVPATLQRIANGLRRYVLETDRPFIVPGAMPSASAHAGEVRAFLAKHYTERNARDINAASLFDPAPTITTVDHNALVTVQFGEAAHQSEEVRAFCIAYFGNDRDGFDLFKPARTMTCRDRYALITVHGRGATITDIGQRMLTPREAFNAQGFDRSYIIDHGIDVTTGERIVLTKGDQMRCAGNSVCPPVAAAIVSANFTEQRMERAA